jgi:acetylornithine deacetylase/succinyl-diaminopimelate desuccinylase-like protein
MAYFHVTLRTGDKDLHSGVYGGAALNAAHALMQTLSAAVSHDGTLAEPALDVNGIQTGSPILQKTVLPVEAIANVSIRLAPGQKVEEIAPEVERILREAAPAGADLTVDLWSSSPPGLVPPDAKAVQLGLDAFEKALGRRPALIRSGGTLPIVPALTDKGIPTVITGFGLPDSQIHSPNERLVADYVSVGTASARELYLAFAAR